MRPWPHDGVFPNRKIFAGIKHAPTQVYGTRKSDVLGDRYKLSAKFQASWQSGCIDYKFSSN
jgi:hypothetical protein